MGKWARARQAYGWDEALGVAARTGSEGQAGCWQSQGDPRSLAQGTFLLETPVLLGQE